jgi:hypothetical protein
MPPPSCTGMSSPTALRIDLIACVVLRLAGKGAVQVHQMQPRAPLFHPLERHGRGVLAKRTVDWSMSPCLRRTQWPSLRSIAGIKIMSVGHDAVDKEVRSRKSGVPVQEIAVQGQTLGGALLRVELRRKNIIACNRGGKASAVIGLARSVACFRRMGVEAVHEIEPARVRHAAPHRVDRALVRRLERPGSSPSAAPCNGCRPVASGRPGRTFARPAAIRPKPGVSGPSALCSSSICMPTQTPNSGFFAAASSTEASRPDSRSSRMQSGIAPCPGRTTRSASNTCCALDVMTTSTPVSVAAWITACATERRLPMP